MTLRTLFILSSLIAGCSSPSSDSSLSDSTYTQTDTLTLSAEETEADGYESVDFYISESLQGTSVMVFDEEHPIESLANTLYWPDEFKNEAAENDYQPAYVVDKVELVVNDVVNAAGQCSTQTLLQVTRADGSEGELIDIHFLWKENNAIVSSKVTFDGSYAQTSASVFVTPDYRVSENCAALGIERYSEGGDINLTRTSELTLYMATDTSPVAILDLVLEDTVVQDYEVSGDENKDSSSEKREIEILTTSTNGFYDIQVTLTRKNNGEISEQAASIYKFNGEKYVEEIH